MASQENPHAHQTRTPHVWEQLSLTKEAVLEVAKNRAVNTEVMNSSPKQVLEFKDKGFLLTNPQELRKREVMASMIVSVYGEDRKIKCGNCRITGGIHGGCVCFPGGNGISAVGNGACANCIYRNRSAECEYNLISGVDAQPPTKRHTGKQQPWRRRCQFVTDINEYFRLSKQDKHYDDPAPFNGCQLHLTPMPLEAKQLEAARQEAARQEAMRQEAVQLEPRPSRGSFTADSNLHDDPVQVGWRDITFKLIPVRGNEELRGTDPEQALESFYHQRRGQRYGQQHQRSEDYHTQHEARGGYGSKGQVHGSYRNQDLSKNYYSGPGQQPKLYNYGMGNDYDDGVNYTGDTCFLQDEPPHLPRANPRSLPARTVSQASSSVSSQHRAAQANCEFSQVRPVSQAPSSLASQQDSRRRAILQAFNPPPIEAPPARQAAPRNGFQTLSSATSSLASANQTIISGNPQTFSPPIEAPPARQAAPQNNFQALSNPSSATSSPALANQIVNGNGSGPGHLSATQTFSRDTGGTSSTISGDSLRQEPRATILIDTSPQSNSTQATAQVANPRGRWMAVREIQLMSREEAEAPRATRSKKQNPITSLI